MQTVASAIFKIACTSTVVGIKKLSSSAPAPTEAIVAR